MRLFRRGSNDHDDDASMSPEEDPSDEIGEAVDTISAMRPTDEDRARIESALVELESAGIDVDDLASLSAAFDAAVDRGDVEALPVLAIGVGEYLNRHALMRWAVITDSFGRDLGLEGQRRDIHVIPDSLLSARWMRREKRWLEGAVRHLADVCAR